MLTLLKRLFEEIKKILLRLISRGTAPTTPIEEKMGKQNKNKLNTTKNMTPRKLVVLQQQDFNF